MCSNVLWKNLTNPTLSFKIRGTVTLYGSLKKLQEELTSPPRRTFQKSSHLQDYSLWDWDVYDLFSNYLRQPLLRNSSDVLNIFFKKAENTVTNCLMVPFALVPEMTTSTALPKFEGLLSVIYEALTMFFKRCPKNIFTIWSTVHFDSFQRQPPSFAASSYSSHCLFFETIFQLCFHELCHRHAQCTTSSRVSPVLPWLATMFFHGGSLSSSSPVV